MEIPTYTLFLLGCLGAADIALFHSVAHGIRSHPDSAKELITHSLRGPTYAALFVLIPNFATHGLFAWGLLTVFVFDVGISIWDFSVEQGSRRFLGGLPSGEYVLHMLMAIAFGALVATFLASASPWFNAPTRLVYAPAAVPSALRFTLVIMATLVLVSGIQDAAAALRLKALGLRTSEPSPPTDGLSAARHRNCPEPVSNVEPAPARRWMRPLLVAAG